MSTTENVVIIGSGPAGYTAAIYASRANLNPLLIEGEEPGGQLTTTTDVENFPGFADGIQGPELMQNMKKQAQRFGTKIINSFVTNVDFSSKPYKVSTSDNQTYLAKSVIISTGASAKYLGLPNEKELIGRGVSACATCDGFFFKDQIIHVVGGGDTAMEEASFLTKFAKKVYVIHRRDSLRASKVMQDRCFKNDKIEFIFNSEVKEILFDDSGVKGLKLLNNQTNEVTTRDTDGFFLAIGHTPNTSFLGDSLKLDNSGFIVTHDGPCTNIEGVYACGDVQDHYYRQAITAAGSGCQAAMKAEKYLEELDS